MGLIASFIEGDLGEMHLNVILGLLFYWEVA